jgi:CRISPR-associated protein Cmr3
MKAEGDLWSYEPRVGLERDLATRTAKEGQLYSTAQIRPHNGELKLGVMVGGIEEAWHPQEPLLIPLGGEGRLARVEVVDPPELFPTPPNAFDGQGDMVRFMVILATPGWYENLSDVVRKGPPGLPGNCVSACIGKLQRVGGWDLQRRKPRPLEPILPAGSCWFMEASAKEAKTILEWHGKVSGHKAQYGFGKLLIGNWGGREK